MNYHNITWCDFANGEGSRVVLWMSGCTHKCPNCHNPQTWDYNSGIPFDESAKEELFKYLSMKEHHGITFSGGDPLALKNREEVCELMKEIKQKFPDKNIWCYTGYTWESVCELENIQYIDVLVDGRFVEALSKPSPKWKGSTNQRVIDVKKTLKQDKIILHV